MRCLDCGSTACFDYDRFNPRFGPPVSVEYCTKCGEVQAVDPA